MTHSHFVSTIGLWCLCGCSLQDLDHLGSGSSLDAGGTGDLGGSSGQTYQVGGRVAVAGSGAVAGTISRAGAAGRASQSEAGSTAAGAAQGTSGSGGIAGDGGTSSGGGSTSSGGTSSSSGGMAGSPSCGNAAGSPTVTLGSAGTSSSANGVAVLTVPLTAAGQGQRFNYENYDGKGTYDLTCATLNIVAYAPGATGGNLHVFFTTASRVDSGAFDIALSSLTGGFQTISIAVPSTGASGYDPATLFVVRLEVEAGIAFGASWQTPATVVYIDSISTSNGVFKDTFDATPEFALLATSGARSQTGSGVSWVSQISAQGGNGGSAGAGQAGAAGSAGTGQAGAAGSAGTGQAGAGGVAGNATVIGSVPSSAGTSG